MKHLPLILTLSFCLNFLSCEKKMSDTSPPLVEEPAEAEVIEKPLKKYAKVKLEADLTSLDERQKAMLILFIQAAEIMDDLFWREAYGKKKPFMAIVPEEVHYYAKINYGPWDRLNDNKPYLSGFPAKPLGANFYPADMTREEFEKAGIPEGKSKYTLIRRDGTTGELIAIPYHIYFKEKISKASNLLDRAASYAKDPGLKNYLLLRSKALLTDDYFESDMAWMDMKNNQLDFIVGPIETYEDRLFGYKASHEAFVLLKDMEWSEKLDRFVNFLPRLQYSLPVPPEYKSEEPGTGSELAVYDALYYAGEANAGGKTIAINLPNDEQVQLEKGTRRLQLKNTMRAKFDQILLPIADSLIDPKQLHFVKFDAFFTNVMFHEVAHGLGIKKTINGRETVREALKDQQSHLEEGKADILGLYMVNHLLREGQLDGLAESYMVTFLAGIFRSVRFGASAHGTANMICFNFLAEKGAFERTDEGKYLVNFEKMEEAINELTALILTLQGDGDYEGVKKLTEEMGHIPPYLQQDLNRLKSAGIPDDIVFEQGIKVLGL